MRRTKDRPAATRGIRAGPERPVPPRAPTPPRSRKRDAQPPDWIADGYYEVDLEGNYTLFNEGLLDITGYSAEEQRGMNNRRLVDAPDHRKIARLSREVYRTGRAAHAVACEVIRKDGTRRKVEVSVALRHNAAGRRCGFRGIARDITAQRECPPQLEARIDALQRENRGLEAANTALRALVKQVEGRRTTSERAVRRNITRVVLPHLQRVKAWVGDRDAPEALGLLEESLNTLFAPFVHADAPHLTAAEIDVASLILQGKGTVEIAGLLNVSPKAIEVHRHHLRRKFGLTRKNTGLRAYLLSLR